MIGRLVHQMSSPGGGAVGSVLGKAVAVGGACCLLNLVGWAPSVSLLAGFGMAFTATYDSATFVGFWHLNGCWCRAGASGCVEVNEVEGLEGFDVGVGLFDSLSTKG